MAASTALLSTVTSGGHRWLMLERGTNRVWWDPHVHPDAAIRQVASSERWKFRPPPSCVDIPVHHLAKLLNPVYWAEPDIPPSGSPCCGCQGPSELRLDVRPRNTWDQQMFCRKCYCLQTPGLLKDIADVDGGQNCWPGSKPLPFCRASLLAEHGCLLSKIGLWWSQHFAVEDNKACRRMVTAVSFAAQVHDADEYRDQQVPVSALMWRLGTSCKTKGKRGKLQPHACEVRSSHPPYSSSVELIRCVPLIVASDCGAFSGQFDPGWGCKPRITLVAPHV
jgi:hypothetical protein